MSQSVEFDARSVLITGGAGGIGLALARAYHSAGARVFLSDLDPERLSEAAASLSLASAPCDVTRPDAVADLVTRAWDEIGPIDLLCANAGVVRPAPLMEVDRRDADWQFEVNVWGVLNVCRGFVTRLREAGRAGHVLITGSEASLSHAALNLDMHVGVYHMTKHAVFSLADQLRHELAGDRIGVSVLCPGPTSTELSRNSAAARPGDSPGAESASDQAPAAGFAIEMQQAVAARLKTPEEVAAIAVAGVARGLFVIPTHPHIQEDVAARQRDIERGFELL